MDDAIRRKRFDRERSREHKRAAAELGHTLLIEANPDISPNTHSAFAIPLGGDPHDRRFLMHGRSEADAAMKGRSALEAIVLHGWPWPSPDLAYKAEDTSHEPTVRMEFFGVSSRSEV